MILEAKEIKIHDPSQLYASSSYPSKGLFLVDTGSSRYLIYNSGQIVAFVTGDNMEPYLGANTPAGVTEDFALRIMETAIRETKKP